MTLHKYSEIHYIDWMEMYKLDTIDDTSKIFWDTLYRSEIHYIDWMEMYKLDTIDDTSKIFWDTLYRLNGNV